MTGRRISNELRDKHVTKAFLPIDRVIVGALNVQFQFCFGFKFLLLYLVHCDRVAAIKLRQTAAAEMQCCMPILL